MFFCDGSDPFEVYILVVYIALTQHVRSCLVQYFVATATHTSHQCKHHILQQLQATKIRWGKKNLRKLQSKLDVFVCQKNKCLLFAICIYSHAHNVESGGQYVVCTCTMVFNGVDSI